MSNPEIRFKIDENLPVEVSHQLLEAGYDAVTVWDEQLHGATDAIISAVCQNEGRILITLDLDFANVQSYPPQELPGLIVLRLRYQDKPHVLEVMERLIPLLSDEPVRHLLWIVDETHIRIRGK